MATLRALIVEDSPDDCRLVLYELQRGGMQVEHTRVQTAAALAAELDRGGWDVVISDFELPGFSGREALAQVRAHHAAPPFILGTGAVGEDIAVNALKAGASDYVMKGNLSRLGPAVQRALREHAAARERREMEQALRQSEADYLDLIENAADGIFVCDVDGRYANVNPRLCEMLGYTRDELMALGASATVPAINPAEARLSAGGTGSNRHIRFESMVQRKDGSAFPAEFSARVSHNGKVQCVVRDVSERRGAEERVARLNRIYAVLSGITSMIVRVRSREELFREACRIAVEEGGFSIAWIGRVDAAERRLVPVAWAGPAERQLELIRDRLRLDDPANASLSARAINERRVMVSNSVESDARVLSGSQLAGLGTRSLAVLPLELTGEPIGNFSLYAVEAGFFDDKEIRLLRDMANNLNFALNHLQKLDKLDDLAYYDELTGLPNRNLFLRRVTEHLRKASETHGKVAVGLFDLDGFKTINDTFGRQAGDELLRQIARRSADGGAPRDSRFARVGPDQFGIVTPLDPDQDFVRRLEWAFDHYFGQPLKANNTELHVSGKAGFAIYPDDGEDAETVFRKAEAAVKKAKASGERYLFYTQEMTHRVAERVMLASKLRQALENGAFVLHYQPKVELLTRSITGVEALMRWTDPETGRAVPPAEFIPLLEETGLIMQAGAWALRQAVRDRRAWREAGLDAPRVAVNVSPVQLRRHDFAQSVRKVIEEEQGEPGLDLEITESVIMEDVAGNIRTLLEIKELGVSVAVDDFGTGYSSLGYLARLPVATLKIDRSFVSTMLEDSNTMTLVSTIIALAHTLGLRVVAEGVEEESQAHALRLLRCDQIQGYLVSRPMPASQLAAFVAQWKNEEGTWNPG